MSERYEYYNTGDNNQTTFFGSNRIPAQTFTPLVSHKITSVKVKLFRYGFPGDIVAEIRTVDGNGHPTDTVLCSGSASGNGLPTSAPGEWLEITLGDGYDLEADTKYALVLRAPDGTADGFARWRRDDTGTYPRGNFEYWNGSTWGTNLNRDFMFEDWGEPPPPPVVGRSFGYITA